MKQDFLIVDDSELDCFIAEKMIRHSALNIGTVDKFTEAGKALRFIADRPVDEHVTILLLDILMPVLSGFDFVEAFEKLPEPVQQNYLVVALTSTMNKNDLTRIMSYKTVRYLLDKPITAEALAVLLKKLDADAALH